MVAYLARKLGHWLERAEHSHRDAYLASSVASLTLYEPSAFHLLKAMGARGVAVSAEILATKTAEGVITGDYSAAAISFVDYWGGRAWAALRPSVQTALKRWAPKAPLDFRAAN
jgi:hypothetical protein